MVAFAVAAASLTSASVLSLAFSGDYLLQFITVPSVLAALVFVVVVGFINFYGISESVRLNLIFTCIEITGLSLIVLIGIVTLGTGTGEPCQGLRVQGGHEPATGYPGRHGPFVLRPHRLRRLGQRGRGGAPSE